MKSKKLLVAIIAILFALSGCAKAVATEAAPMYAEERLYDNSLAAGTAMDSVTESAEAPKAAFDEGGTTPIKQMIIMNADLTIAVDDPGVSMDEINQMANDMGGFVVSSYIYKTQSLSGLEVPEATITVRVPAEKLNTALDEIKSMTGDAAKYTLTENISGTDVTQEYTDLSSRLRNLEEANDKLTELYDAAEKTEDALAIYTQKMQVTEQIEVIKGQMQYYEQSADLSAITVRIVAKETIAPVTIAGWQPQGVARDAVQALINFGKGFVEFLIWLVILVVPVIVVIGAPIYFLVRWLVRRNRRKQAAKREAMLNAMKNQQPPSVK